MSDIIISKDVYEEIKIKDYTGKLLSQFSFNPSDANIFDRYNKFVAGFEDLRDEIQAYEKEAEKGNYDKNFEKLDIINNKIYERLDYLLNAEVSKNIFSVMGPLSPLPSGDYYFTFILEQIMKKIQNATGARIYQMDMKIRKHTAKYHN